MPENPPDPPGPQDALFVGDDLALDFINTSYGVGPAHRECFIDDASVLGWLKAAGALGETVDEAPEGLLALALALRESAKSLVCAAKAGSNADAAVVNHVLEAGRAARTLEWDGSAKAFRFTARRRSADAACLLEPVAQGLVTLLTDTPMALVRQCEAHDCTLLFHDMTKSHRRRWCSMAACGNRMKVAAFRSRKKTGN
ncbi:hypothetical protein GN316_06840 [Xylophilus sp. Kf1]|nr:hypothetical protein [Xylophilus sp. Kf1]